jgi:serine/threonine protein kinase/tetratricopeptide (TPR) repeat protein
MARSIGMIDNNASAADPFGQIADEFVEAFRQGKNPSVEEFAGRYPEHADEIREVLPALLLMEKAKSGDDTTGQSRRAGIAAAPMQQLGDYQILREVGRGGMGVVYEAQQLSLSRHVAIKVLPAHALLDPRQLGRFQREARAAARLHHTNIVPVFGVGEQNGLHYYVMQFIQGLGLDRVLDELRRLRQPGAPALTADDVPVQPTRVTRDVSVVDVARGLLSGQFPASGGREPPEDAESEPALVTPSPTLSPSLGPGVVRTGLPSERVRAVEGEGVREGKERWASASAPAPRSSDTSATIRLPGQSEASTLSESGNQYWQSVARVGMQVADALAHAASQGVLHRDIKPSNLLLDDTGNVWVTDFGLAKAASDSDDLTHTGDIIGTLRYLAPERFNGQGDVRSDVYSLGLTLYEMLALRPAFDEADRNQLVKQVMHDEPVRPRKLNPSVPRDLETVVLKAIARDLAHRYQSPTEMAEDLKRFVEDRPVRARRISNAEKLWRWCRRNPLPASLAAVIVLVFLVGFAGVFWQWREAEAARADERDQRQTAQKAQADESRQRQDAIAARATAESEATRANREAAAAAQVSDFLVGLFEARDRAAVGAWSGGFRKTQEELRARDLLARGVERLKAAELEGQPLVRARLLHEIGMIYISLGDAKAAAPLCEEALKLRRAFLPPDHPDLARSMHAAGVVRYVNGDWSCIDLFREAVAILEKPPDPESLELAEALSGLAFSVSLFDKKQAIELYTHALKIRRERLGEYDMQTLSTLFLLAYTHLEMRDYVRGLALASQMVQGFEKSSADPVMVEALRDASRAVQKELFGGRADDIIPIWQKVAAQLAKVLGNDHFVTAYAKRKTAMVIYDNVRADDPRFLEAIRIFEEGLDIGPPWMRNLSRMDLARALMRQSRDAEAEPHFVQALAQFRKDPPYIFAGNEPHALQLLAWIAERSGDSKKQARVEGLLNEALAAARSNPHTPPGRLGLALRDVAIYRLTRKKDAVTSAPLFAEAAELFIKAEGATDLRVAEALAFQALALRMQGKTQEADALRQQAEAIERRHAKNQSKLAWAVRELLKGEIPPWPS